MSAGADSGITDWAAVHRACIDGLEQVASRLGPGDADRVVPATPEWTVQQVFAHLAGGAADGVAGRMDGAPGPEWTARHVAERTGVAIPDLVAELRSTQAAIEAIVAGADRPAVVWDRAVHLADLHELLGLGRPNGATWQAIADQMRPMLAAILGAETLGTIDDSTVSRIAFSRRSQGQLAELFPDADAATLARVGVFGPREDHQPAPPSL